MSISLTAVTTYDPSLGRRGSAPTQELDSNAFMQLLVAQLRFQDPLKGMDQQSFMQQLATMSSMEQQQSINTNLAGLVKQSQVTQAAGLVGREVHGVDNDQVISGVVKSVSFGKDEVWLDIGDKRLPFAKVDQVK
jgi:flagellar basal-body rod modification protein FlgD